MNRLLSDAAPHRYPHSGIFQSIGNPCTVPALQHEGVDCLPDALAPFHRASKAERRRRVRDVIRWAWRLYRAGGVSLVECMREASGGGAESHYALNELRRVLLHLDLTSWEQHPHRTRADVHRLFRKAINQLGHRRGGWQVSQ